jgi:hypothetical protein
MSLARLWRQQGNADAAQQLLAEGYGWFTEGFDTADLQEVQGLLQECSTQSHGSRATVPIETI